jgi:hypothetical protein
MPVKVFQSRRAMRSEAFIYSKKLPFFRMLIGWVGYYGLYSMGTRFFLSLSLEY